MGLLGGSFWLRYCAVVAWRSPMLLDQTQAMPDCDW
uniref:Uncharacterized protein n=1 Tax=Anguilla anguilla TaxID=7936 RepID=A0A0E9VDG2_ANGAN